jgi:hypothetical protein
VIVLIDFFCYFVEGTIFEVKKLKKQNGFKIFAKN